MNRISGWISCKLYLSFFFTLITAVSAQILINEVRPADETSDYCSYVELKNTGSGAQSLDGWIIKYTPSDAIQGNPGDGNNLGATGFIRIPGGITMQPDGYVVFYVGCSGNNSANVQYVPNKNPIPRFCNISLYDMPPTVNGALWYSSKFKDFVRFGPGNNPPREVVWDWESRSSDVWAAKHASGILVDIHVKNNQWPDTNDYVNTTGLAPDASISHDGTDSNSPEDWIFTMPTPGTPNETTRRPALPPLPPSPIEDNSQSAKPLTDTRPILYALSFDHFIQGDYPRDWFYHLMTSNVLEEQYQSAAKITGVFAVNKENGERGLWVSPSSYTVVNHNMAVAVFGDGSWTDYRMTFTVKESSGDIDQHQLCEFYVRLVDDTNRVEGYQFNLFGGTSVSVRNKYRHGADFGKVTIHRDVDFWGGGQESYQMLAENHNQIVNPGYNKLYVTLEVKGNKISSKYDNKLGGSFEISANDDTYKSGNVGLGLVYGNYIYNDILVEDLKDNPTGSVPVAVVSPIEGTKAINTDINFSAESSIYSGDQTKLKYLWDFGDGYRGQGQRPIHKFAAMGTYRVTCTLSDGENQTTDGFFITITASNDRTAPSNVSNLQADTKNGAIILTWDGASDDQSGISGYVIYRGTGSNPTVPLVTIRNITEFTDNSGKVGLNYYYRVKAINGVKSQSSSYSNEVHALKPVDLKRKFNNMKTWLMVKGNPTGKTKHITVYSPIKQAVTIQILSPDGKHISTIFRGTISGTKNWIWNTKDYNTGLYLIRLKMSDRILINKVFIL
ncbi:MAG: PKD domain-containing protein [Fibrobacteria bacterium]|nr:PKD domain-containing protein [Fibrobacteria bacterium]